MTELSKMSSSPLSAHEIPLRHLSNECADPPWCAHDLPIDIEGPVEDIKTVPIPQAIEPTVLFVANAQRFQPRVIVDTDLITQELINSGFKESTATSYAVVFHDRDDLVDTDKVDVGGWHNPHGHMSIKDGEFTHHPLAVHVVFRNNQRRLNRTLWHEFGHGHLHKVKRDEQETLYNRDHVVESTKKIGKGAALSGGLLVAGGLIDGAHHTGNPVIDNGLTTVGGFLIVTGLIMDTQPHNFLWQIDKREFYAQRFAYKRKNLRPITLLS